MSADKLLRDARNAQRPQAREEYALGPAQGFTYRYGIDFTVKAGEIETTNGAAFIEYTTKTGEEPEAHTHLTEDEMFYVLEGTLTFKCGGQTFDVDEGGFVFLPQGIEHGYTIRSAGPVRLLVVTAPARQPGESWGGFVADFESTGDLVGQPSRA